jgi:hypothetical protein
MHQTCHSYDAIASRYQPIDNSLIPSDEQNTGSIIREFLRPSQTYPTRLTARLTKYLIALLSRIESKKDKTF